MKNKLNKSYENHQQANNLISFTPKDPLGFRLPKKFPEEIPIQILVEDPLNGGDLTGF